MKNINKLLLCITLVSAYGTVRTENLDTQISLKNEQDKAAIIADKFNHSANGPTGSTTNTGISGNTTGNHNHGSIDPQTIITTIEDIITIVEAVSGFIHNMIPTSTTTTSTGKLELLKLSRKLSDDEIEKVKAAHDFLKAGILKIFETEEKILGK